MPRNPTSWEKAHQENCLESLRNVTFKLLKRKTMKYKRSSETEGVDPKPEQLCDPVKNPAGEKPSTQHTSSRCWVYSSHAFPWTVAGQAPLCMEFSRQEYWNGLPFSSPGDVPHPGIKPMSLMSPALTSGFFTTRATLEAIAQGTLLNVLW